MANPITTYTSTMNIGVSWEARVTAPSGLPVASSVNTASTAQVSSATPPAAKGGANQAFYQLTSIPASGSLTVDLTACTNVVNQAGSSFARVKSIRIRLLNEQQLAADGTTKGTLASHVTVNGDFASGAGGRGWLTTDSTLEIGNGDAVAYGGPSAAGILVDATHKTIQIANGDAALPAIVEIFVSGGES